MPSVKVLQSVAHMRHHLHEGEVYDDLSQADINTLKELGFVEDIAPQTGVTESQPVEDNLDDLVGGEKAEAAPKNKMAPAPANKGKK